MLYKMFWGFTWRWFFVRNQRVGTTCMSHLQGLEVNDTLKMGQTRSPEMLTLKIGQTSSPETLTLKMGQTSSPETFSLKMGQTTSPETLVSRQKTTHLKHNAVQASCQPNNKPAEGKVIVQLSPSRPAEMLSQASSHRWHLQVASSIIRNVQRGIRTVRWSP
jgi:hypothetical protein